MPQGKGTYGDQVGRPPKRSALYQKSSGKPGYGSPIKQTSNYNLNAQKKHAENKKNLEENDWLYKNVTKHLQNFTMGAGEVAVESFSSPQAMAETVAFYRLPVGRGFRYAKSKLKRIFKRK
jgi:hypothetical protein